MSTTGATLSTRTATTAATDGCLSALDESRVLPGRHTLVAADNATLRLRSADGHEREYTDFTTGYAAVNFGHRNPRIERALRKSSDLSAYFYPPEAEEVARWLCRRLGDEQSRRVLYQIGGSFAVATALAMARRHRTGRVMAVAGAFHGLGVDALAATTVQRDLALQDTGFAALVADEITQVAPGELPEDWDGVSCLIYEPVQGGNGYVPLDREWLRRLVASARAAGVVTIADEIQCGYFRHGVLSPSAAAGLDPDAVLYGKSLTNGMYPLSAVVYKRFLETDAAPVYLAHTFQTGTLGPTAAGEVCRYIDEHDVTGMAASVEAGLRVLADELTADGLARAVHVVGPALSFEPSPVTAREVVTRAFGHGVLTFAGGRHGERVRVAPPLTVPGDQLAAGVDALRRAVRP